MQVAGFHLTYCSNIHPGESWDDVSAALAEALPRVRAELAVGGPLGIGSATTPILESKALSKRERERPLERDYRLDGW